MLTLSQCASQVHPGLWVSAMPAGSWPLEDWGVALVVSVADHLPPQAARRFAWGTRGDAVGQGRIVFLHWPIEDGDVPPLVLAELVAGAVTDAVRGGLTVLLHCQEGRNRSGFVAALATRQLLSCSGSEALARVRSARPGMLSNRRFADALEQLPGLTV